MKRIPIFCFASLTLILSIQPISSQTAPAPPDATATQPEPPKRVRVSMGVLQTMIVNRVNPKFTKEQQKEREKKRIQGQVHLIAIIGTTGDVVEVKAIDGDPLLTNPSIEAVTQWKFRPYLLNGTPVEVETTITFNFTLSGG